MNGTRLPDGTTPTQPGEYSWMEYAARHVRHPDEVPGAEGEWWACDPNGHVFRLTADRHTWKVGADGTLTVKPSIVSPVGGYHGFLQAGKWS